MKNIFICNAYKVTYLGHSAFRVDYKDYILFFDYTGTVSFDRYKVLQDDVDFTGLNGKKVFMFHSHDHFDHYNRNLHQTVEKILNIKVVLGNIECNFKNTFVMDTKETLKIDSLMVHTADSTDMGVCFLVKVDDLVIFHGGDNANWSIEDSTKFYNVIDYIKGFGFPIDIAFIPVCNFSAKRSKSITEGAMYTIKTLNPKRVFPMHANGKENAYLDFKTDALKENIENEIICMERVVES